MKKTFYKTLFATAVLALPLRHVAHAQAGMLDATFGDNGVSTLSIGNVVDHANAVAVQSDGKIVLAGFSSNGVDLDIAVVRYNAGGSLDNTFGNGGIALTDIGTFDDVAEDIAIQPDGKIIVAGSASDGSHTDYALVRYNADGTLDAGFGNGGTVVTPTSPGDDNATCVKLQADGKIVAAGGTNVGAGTPTDFSLVRYNGDGTLDVSFGIAGIAITNFAGDNEAINDLVITSDGKFFAAGQSYNAGYDFAFARYNQDGSLDAGFDGDGKMTLPIGTMDDLARGLALQSDGKIIAVGDSYIINGSNYYSQFAAVRFNADGTLDNSFGNAGVDTTTIGTTYASAFAAAVQPDGKIIVAGRGGDASVSTEFALVRYNTDGSLDNTFGTNGVVLSNVGGNSSVGTDMAVQSDNKIVMSGYVSEFDDNFAVARFDPGTINNVESNDAERTISFSPNPFTNTIAVRHTSSNGELTAVNVLGEVVRQIKTNDGATSLNTADFAPGYYTIRYTDGTNTTTAKVVKH